MTEEAVAPAPGVGPRRPTAYRPDLASSLTNLGVWLSVRAARPRRCPRPRRRSPSAGSWPPPTPTPTARPRRLAEQPRRPVRRAGPPRPRRWPRTEEAVTLRRELAAANRDAYLPDLAASLNNLGVWFSEMGRPAEALAVYRGGGHPVPGAGRRQPRRLPTQPRRSLTNLGVRLGELGRRAEALAAYRGGGHPLPGAGRRQPRRLPTQPRRLGEQPSPCGSPRSAGAAEALAATEEAVTLRRELAAANRDAYLPDLATSLWMFAVVRQSLGTETGKAVDAAKEAESIFSALAAAEPAAFTELHRAVQDLLRKLRDEA